MLPDPPPRPQGSGLWLQLTLMRVKLHLEYFKLQKCPNNHQTAQKNQFQPQKYIEVSSPFTIHFLPNLEQVGVSCLGKSITVQLAFSLSAFEQELKFIDGEGWKGWRLLAVFAILQ